VRPSACAGWARGVSFDADAAQRWVRYLRGVGAVGITLGDI
jgi:hypothetical protein